MKSRLFYLLILAISLCFISGTIDLDNLLNYQNQDIPEYITKDNTIDNPITDAGATLGRVLFYDKKLSLNNSISCSSCHLQEFAFGDTAQVSLGFSGGMTGRHAMRLVNARFGSEHRFFWDERAANLEAQSSQPIQDHIEMGFSGTAGQPDIDSLFAKLESIDYYNYLFEFVYGDLTVTEERIQLALSQFIRSIQSFDSKFDIGRAQVDNNIQPFPNFTPEENLGKVLFLTPPEFDLDGIRIDGGAGCQQCHRAPEFDISPFARNNGVIGSTTSESGIDLSNTRSPSLRDLINPQGQLNGGMMHSGEFTSLEQVIDHYDQIPNNPLNTNLDPRLRPSGTTQNLNLTDIEKSSLIAFLRTLTGSDIYTNEKWSNPFDENDELNLIGGPIVSTNQLQQQDFKVFPNPASNYLVIEGISSEIQIDIFNQLGQPVLRQKANSNREHLSLEQLASGVYFVVLKNDQLAASSTTRLLISK